MVAKAKSRFVRISPYKLRPLVDGIRGKRVDLALAWLMTRPAQRGNVVIKTLNSAWANARVADASLAKAESAVVVLAKVDQGPTVRYYKPGAQGRSVTQRKRLSHIEIGVAGVAARTV